MRKKFLFIIIVGIFFLPNLLLAQVTSDFTISALVGDDLIPPTTPVMLSVIPVASTQIDVTWSASTDNILLSGYVLFRDGAPIATTTLTTYLDNGLLASTTYAYEVYAFDLYNNISTTSNSLSTTTPDVPVIVTPTASSTPNNSGTLLLRLDGFAIETNTNEATFTWQTNMASRFSLRWGRDDSYDDGYILNDIYHSKHQTLINELEPGTVYLYELIGYGPSGIAVSLKKGQFKTKAKENLNPANVQNLQATVTGSDVSLSWEMPFSEVDSRIRIVRSYLGYPTDPNDGAIIYEGKVSSYFDSGALANYNNQYYTVFVFDNTGSVSSGAVVRARRVTGDFVTTATSTGVEDPFEEELIEVPDFGFSANNINLSQGGNNFTFDDEVINLLENEAFVISIPFGSLPQHLKSIIVTLSDPADFGRSYSFLLRINKDRSAYEAIIAPLRVMGTARLQIEIYDFEREIIGRYRKQINFIAAKESMGEVFFPDKLVRMWQPIYSISSLIFLALCLILFLLWKRSKEAEDKT